jgi:hypothetical protein
VGYMQAHSRIGSMETASFAGAPDNSVTTQINPRATPTFAVFVTGQGPVPFDPAVNRILVRFVDGGGVVRGATSVGARTE